MTTTNAPAQVDAAPVVAGVAALPAVFGVETLAQLLGVSVHAARGLLRKGYVPASRIGKRWIIRGAAFVDALRKSERRRASASEP